MGMDFDEMYPGKFIKAADLKGQDFTYTVKAIHLEELEGNKGKQTKGILSFVESPKQLALNKTNGLCLKAMFGRDTGKWVGKRVTLFPEPIDFEDVEICIRVRGSPDIEADIQAEIKLPRKKPRTRLLKKTGAAPASRPAPKGKPPNVYERIVMLCLEFGRQTEEVGAIIKAATLKTNAKQLLEEDIAKVRAHLVPGSPLPSEDDDIPF